MTNEDNKKNFNSTVFFAVIITVLIIIATMIVSYAFFQYARIGRSNTLATGQIHVQFVDTKNINIGNAFPIDFDELDNTYESTFTLKVDSEIPEGLRYKVYAEMGDEVSGKNRLDDGVMSILFTAPTDGDGYLTTLNNYSTAKSPAFVNNRALISTGIIENADTTVAAKEYKLSLWIDSDKILVSSTTKRANNEEGFPSLADTSAGNTTALRYIANDDNLVNTTLYPAESEHEGKIVYTTKELSTSYYSIKIGIEIEEVEEDEYLVYFDSQGGSISTESMMVTAGRNYPSLPVPTREGYTFLGWNGKNLINDNQNIRVGHFKSRTSNSIEKINGYNYIKLNGANQTTIIDTSWAIMYDTEMIFNNNRNYTLSLDIRSNNCLSSQLLNKELTGIRYNLDDIYSSTNKIVNLPQNLSFNNNDSWNRVSIKITIPNDNNSGFFVIANDWPDLFGNNCYLYIGKVQIEEGTVATEYEPYYITSDTNVVQEKDHTLKAIWEPNS